MAAILGSIWQSLTEKTPDTEDEQTTPKMAAVKSAPVPSFSFEESMPPPQVPLRGQVSAQQGLSPARGQGSAQQGLSAPARGKGLSPASLAPPTGPIPNRGPPSNSQQRAGSTGRGKVLLSPGHSPMDWASLTRTNNLSGVSSFQKVTPSQMKQMNGRKGKPIWSSYQGKVYNITPYLPFHPGGEKELMKCAGRDGTKLFMEIHPWVNWDGMLSACLVGVLIPEGAESALEDID